MTEARQLAFDVLRRFEKGGATDFFKLKADSLLAGTLGKAPTLPDADKALLHALVMGTLRHWIRLDAWIRHLSGRPIKAIEPNTRVLLRMGLFQLSELTQVPAYAAIDTTVGLARKRKFSPKAVGFINAVLREAQRRLEGDGFPVPSPEADFADHVRWQYGWPVTLTETLIDQYGRETVLTMARAAQSPAQLTIRVNTLKTTPEEYRETLQVAGVMAEALPDLPEALLIPEHAGSPRHLPGYEQGWFYVQDPASMDVVHWLAPQPEEHILDLCAAPGSKTTHIAALMQNTGHITAVEPQAERVARLKENIERLGVSNTEIRIMDALQFEPDGTLYDRVLVDAPCSGTGTLRRHPEILLQFAKLDMHQYGSLQSALLAQGFACLKPGGVLVYSTCSLLKAENADVVSRFLQAHPDARLERERQRPITANADGFYTARILKGD